MAPRLAFVVSLPSLKLIHRVVVCLLSAPSLRLESTVTTKLVLEEGDEEKEVEEE